ncbi:MAG: ester cyclase [Chloroflexota bacterium]|nr:MAG: hypothetical protein DIU68_10070 [Chloroflexota bacterium]
MDAASIAHNRRSALVLIASIIALLFGVALQSQSLPTLAQDDTDYTGVIEDVIAAILDGDMEALEAIYAEDYIGHLAQSSDRGSLNRVDLIESALFLASSLSDMELELVHVFGEGDMVASHVIVRGVFSQEFYDYPPTDEPIEIVVTTLHRFNDDGLIVEEWLSYDNHWVMQELGVLHDQ